MGSRGALLSGLGLLSSALVITAGVDVARAQCEANELVKLNAEDAAQSDKFGRSASFDGDTMVIGAFGDENEMGAAYVFVGEGPDWSQQAKLVAPDGQVTDYFGWSVAIDGDSVVVACRNDDDLGDNSGSAYVFVRDGTTWSLQAKLLADDGEAVDLFGESVAIDGDTVVVGAIGDDDVVDRAGAAYVFVRDGTSWSQQAKLVADDAGVRDEFGTSVTIAGDTIVVGSIGDDDNGDCAGAAYVYQRNETTWSLQDKLVADDGAMSDNFGMSVSLHGDRVVVGTPADDDGGATSGSAYLFVRDGADWEQEQKLVASDASPNAQFGESVSLLGDMLVVGAVNEANDGGSGAGSAYVFVRTGRASWTQGAKLLASDGDVVDSFGSSVALSGDTVVIGARNDDDAGNNSGSAYLFRGLDDCNDNDALDICDIADGYSQDDNGNGIPDECECAGDLDGDGDTDQADLGILLADWGCNDPVNGCAGDLDGDDDTDQGDLGILLADWGCGVGQ